LQSTPLERGRRRKGKEAAVHRRRGEQQKNKFNGKKKSNFKKL